MLADAYKLRFEDIDYRVRAGDLASLGGGDWGDRVIGQPRALEALSMGIAIRARGYNVFATGAPGTGRQTAVMRMLAAWKPPRLELRDVAYVFAFDNQLSPRALYFRAGEASTFKKDVHSFVENIKKLVAMHAESGETRKRREELEAGWEKTENSRLAAFEAMLAADGFRVVQSQGEDGQTATDILPLKDGEPVAFDDFQAAAENGQMSEADFASLRQRYFSHMDAMRSLFAELRRGRGSLKTR